MEFAIKPPIGLMTPNHFGAFVREMVRSFVLRSIMVRLFLIGLAGFVGTLGRYWLSGIVARRYGETFPFGTLAVNLIGCFLVGLLFYVMQERFLVDQNVRTIILIGLLGGFTTFSSLGLQTFTLLQDGEFGLAAANLGVSNLIGLFMVWAGYTLARVL
jgi:fluoride exporter